MLFALFLVPALTGLLAFTIHADVPRRILLVAVAAVHAGLTAAAWHSPPMPALYGWIGLDAPGLLFLGITSVLFLMASLYTTGYLKREQRGLHSDFSETGVLFSNAPEAVFTGCLLLFLATMTLVIISRHFGLLWVAVEATTAGQCPPHFLSPTPPVPGSHLEIPSHLLGGHRPGASG